MGNKRTKKVDKRIDIESIFDKTSQSVSNEIKIKIADLVINWARFDSAVGAWNAAILNSYGLPYDLASIMTGNLDTKTRIERIKQIAKHYDMNEEANGIASMLRHYEVHVEIRNAVVHQNLLGIFEEKSLVYFAPKHRLKEVGNFSAFIFNVNELDNAISYITYSYKFVSASIARLNNSNFSNKGPS